MQYSGTLLAFLVLGPVRLNAAEMSSNPLGKVLDLLSDLAAKVRADGEAEAKAYQEYFEWCDDAVQNTNFEIETSAKEKGKLEATISELTSGIDSSGTKIADLAAAISTSEADLKSATDIREKSAGDFAASEKELIEVLSALDRAINILEKEFAKNPASFAQVYNTNVNTVLQSLSLVADAAAFSVTDRQQLLALAQTEQGDDNQEFGAPAAATYKSHSGGIIDVLEDLKEKAESQLAELRKAEGADKQNYEMLKQSLEAQLAADTNDMNEEKAAQAAAEESKATAEGDLERTVKELANAEETLALAHSNCVKTAADHEQTVKSREEELRVIAEATKILQETSSGAVSQTYSLLQLRAGMRMQTRLDLAQSEVIVLVKRLAHEYHSAALAQLASRVAAVARYGAQNGEDPFVKVKGLIQNMIGQLEAEAESEATEKAYCDEQLAKTEAKKEELDDDIAKLTVKIDQASSKSAALQEDVKQVEGELAALTKLQAEMDKIRQETHADYVTAKADLELGLSGVRKALGVLREYYGGAAALLQSDKFRALMQQPEMPKTFVKSEGAGQGIISILEVVESDFATNLAKEETEEADGQSEYDKTTQENKISKTMKEQDVNFKTQEIKSLGKSLGELSADKESADTEHAAVREYYGKIEDRCIAKPETYEERKKRREAEIKGLKEALNILENETSFVQRKRGGHIRGSLVLN